MNVSFGSVELSVKNNIVEQRLFNELVKKPVDVMNKSSNDMLVHIEEGGKAEDGTQDYKIYGQTEQMEKNIAERLRAAKFNVIINKFEGMIPDYLDRRKAGEEIKIR